jgi:N-methylhydantoinase B/oxoprolinase/acetone carboxylase alpha subunit
MKSTLKANKEKERIAIRKPILEEIEKIIKRFGEAQTMYTFRWFITQKSAETRRLEEIKKLEKELEQIKGGKRLYG